MALVSVHNWDMERIPDSHARVLGAFPSLVAVAIRVGEKYPTVAAWHRRNSIPTRVWPSLVSYAAELGLPGITIEHLARLAATRASAGARAEHRNRDLSAKIRAFLSATGMSRREFGLRLSAGRDLVGSIERGRRLQRRTIERIEAYMDENIGRVQALVDCYRGQGAEICAEPAATAQGGSNGAPAAD